MHRISRALVAATTLATGVAIVGVNGAAVAAPSRAVTAASSTSAGVPNADDPLTGSAIEAAPADLGDLSDGTGPIAVALQLPQEPAVLAWHRTSGSARVSTGKRQSSTIAAAQDKVIATAKTVPGLKVLYRLHNAYNGVVVLVPRDEASTLRSIAGVKAVHRLTPMTADNSSSDALIGAPAAWASNGGLTGTGIKIGIVDTGLDYTHRDFGGTGVYAADTDHTVITDDTANFPTAKVPGGIDLAGDAYDAGGGPGADTPVPDPDPLDCAATTGVVGHGTHVAGTAAGLGVNDDGTTYTGAYNASTDLAGMRIGPGVAPKAQIYPIRVFGCSGSTNLVPEAIDWAMDPNGDGDFSDHLDVVNMSLGSSFGTPDDPEAAAVDNAVAAGVQMVISAGNSGNTSYEVGSPGIATRAITVANSADQDFPTDAFRFTPTGGTQAKYPGGNSTAYSFTTHPNPVTAPLFVLDGTACSALTGDDATHANGNIVMVDWIPAGQPTFPCGSAARANNIEAAGGLGMIAADNGTQLSIGLTGNADIPSILTNKPSADAIKVSVPLGTVGGSVTIQASDLRHGTIHDPAFEDTIDGSSSRGPRMVDNLLKPDVASVGNTVFSAKSGSGNDGQSLSGTSMAAPHVAGTMALLEQQHPTWSLSDLKALVMNTADHDVVTDHTVSGRAQSSARQGTGRENLATAITSQVVAYSADLEGAVSVSFGSVQPTAATTIDKTVTLRNHSDAAATYTLGYTSQVTVPGVTYSFPDGPAVTVQPHATASFRFRLSADPALMNNTSDSTLQATSSISAMSESAGRIDLTPSTNAEPKLRVAYLAVVRPASTMHATNAVEFADTSTPGTTTIGLTGTAIDTGGSTAHVDEKSLITPLQLSAVSPRNNALHADADLKAVGISSDRASQLAANAASTAGTVVFGVSTYGPVQEPGPDDTSFRIDIDNNNDGVADKFIVNYRNNVTQGVDIDQFYAAIFNGNGSSGILGSPINLQSAVTPTGAYNTSVLALGVPYTSLGMTGTTVLHYWVSTFDRGSADGENQIGPFTYDLAHPALDFTAGSTSGGLQYFDRPAQSIPVAYNPLQFKAQAAQGVLLLHHFNASDDQAETVFAGPAISSVDVTPATASLAKGTTGQLAATATLADASTVDVTAFAEWSSDNGHATVDNTTHRGLLTGATVGSSTITAGYGGFSDTSAVTVSAATLTGVTVTPATPSLAKGTTQQLTATGTFSDGSTQDLTSAATWSAALPAKASVTSGGLVSALAVSQTKVTATSGAFHGDATITVTPAVLASITLAPASPTVVKGAHQQLTATGHFTDGTTQGVTDQATWSSTVPTTATVSNSSPRGVVTGVAAGMTTVRAAFGGLTGSTDVTVAPAPLTGIVVTPASASVPAGRSTPFRATGTFSDGTSADLTGQVTWSTTNPAIAKVSNTGTVTGVAPGGPIVVRATLGAITGTTSIAVTKAVLTKIAITPGKAKLKVNASVTLVVRGTFSDGTSRVLTTGLVWSPKSNLLRQAKTKKGHKVTALKPGTVTLTVKVGAIKGTAKITIPKPKKKA